MKNKIDIEENLGLVHLCCQRFRGKTAEYDELFQCGCIGLIKAAKNFDSSRNIKFSTYAVPVILGEIRAFFRDNNLLKVSRNLKDLSFKILPGQTAAIVGETGGGKTTVSRLLLRLYESYSGEILVGNKNIKGFDINAYRGLFGVVTQDSWLFRASVIENIRYGNTKVSDDEIKFACEELGAASFIEALPEGYNTILKEGIDNISEGQKQLLCIARALVSNREILVLDEATASVDVFTESKVQTALKTLLKGRTSVVIAHRLSTVKEADVIFVLEKGKLAECGKHEDLISKRGIYYEMYSKS